MESLQAVKQRFGIIGNHIGLNRALEKSLRVASTDISVLVIGESGVGKENIPKIIHQFSHRKHSKSLLLGLQEPVPTHKPPWLIEWPVAV